MAVFVDQWSTTKNIQTHIRVVTEYTYIFDSINITCVISSSHRIPLSHETHDNKLATHRNVCAMSSEAVAMVMVDRKSEASTKLWTVGSKLCGGWRKKVHSWMLGSLSASSSLDSENAIRRTGWAGGSWLEIGRKT